MSPGKLAGFVLGVFLLAVPDNRLSAQVEDRQQGTPDEIPPPLPPKKPPKAADEYRPGLPESDAPWTLPAEILESVRARAAVYQDYARRFLCDERARLAEYDSSGDVPKEKEREYGYLLFWDPANHTVRERRQVLGKDRQVKGEADDSEPFPPAYAWVFLFSEFHQPYFQFRLVGTHFEGYDLVHEIQFRGSLPFTDGKDIRQWEGTVLLDAFRFTPVEIRAQPSGQDEKIEALYRTWAQSFSILGFRTRQPPLAYEAQIQFRYRRDELSFPTELRYDTRRAVSPKQVVAVRASTRTYTHYQFTNVETTDPALGEVKP